MKWFNRLQFRLLAVLGIVALAPVLVVALINLNTTSRIVEEEVKARQIEVTQIVANQVTQFIREILIDMRRVANASYALGMKTDALGSYAHSTLNTTAPSQNIYLSLWVMNDRGQDIGGVIDGRILTTDTLKNRRQDEIFFRPQRGETYFSNVRLVDNLPQISISLPIYDREQLVRVVGATINLRQTWDVIEEVQLGARGYAMLLDRRGNVMVHRDETILEQRYNVASSAPFASVLTNAPLTALTYDSLIGGDVIGSAVKISGPEWVLMLERPTEEAFASQEASRRNIILGVAVAIGIALVLSLPLSQQIANPVIRLRDAVHRFGAGDLSVRSKFQRQDEIGELAQGFNGMADRLQSRIDEINQKNLELHEANEKVLETSRLKDEFLAVMSHELRTPLNAILGFSGILLMDDTLDEKQAFQIQRIETNSERLLNLINDILDISRIQAGRMTFNPVTLDIHRLTNRLYEQLGILAKQKGLLFTKTITPDVPDKIVLDEDAFIKILTNLVSNAIKFTTEGEVSLTLSTDAQKLVVRVQDSGIGIPPQLQEVIFEEFRQVDSSSMRSYGGTGLGLAIVRRLCMALGGNVSVKSRVHEGSTFTVILPLAVPKVSTEEHA